MAKENIRQEFRFKNICETKKYFIEEIKKNELISKKGFERLQIILTTYLF